LLKEEKKTNRLQTREGRRKPAALDLLEKSEEPDFIGYKVFLIQGDQFLEVIETTPGFEKKKNVLAVLNEMLSVAAQNITSYIEYQRNNQNQYLIKGGI
jgi:hypothetical protein